MQKLLTGRVTQRDRPQRKHHTGYRDQHTRDHHPHANIPHGTFQPIVAPVSLTITPPEVGAEWNSIASVAVPGGRNMSSPSKLKHVLCKRLPVCCMRTLTRPTSYHLSLLAPDAHSCQRHSSRGKDIDRTRLPRPRRASAWVRHNRHRVRLNNPHLSPSSALSSDLTGRSPPERRAAPCVIRRRRPRWLDLLWR